MVLSGNTIVCHPAASLTTCVLILPLQGLLAADSSDPSPLWVLPSAKGCGLSSGDSHPKTGHCGIHSATPSLVGTALQDHPGLELLVEPVEASAAMASQLSLSLCPTQLPPCSTGAVPKAFTSNPPCKPQSLRAYFLQALNCISVPPWSLSNPLGS